MLYLIYALMPVLMGFTAPETMLVVERERSRLSVIKSGKLVGRIPDLGNLNHATVKFYKGAGYVISRDGFLTKFDLKNFKVIKKVRSGRSGISLSFVGNHVVVANYNPKNVVVFDLNLKRLKTIETGSRNVGLKRHGQYLIFSLMDKDQIWALDSSKQFAPKVLVKNSGPMPFDALVAGDSYIVGLFKERSLGVLNLKSFTYRRWPFKRDRKEIILKIPHFGIWGVAGSTAWITGIGERRMHGLDLKKLTFTGEIALKGLPVFAIVSPDRRLMVVNYSGDRENFLTVVDLKSGRIVKELEAGKRMLHFRFSADGKRLYASSYYENKVKVFSVGRWTVSATFTVATPSGIFLVP